MKKHYFRLLLFALLIFPLLASKPKLNKTTNSSEGFFIIIAHKLKQEVLTHHTMDLFDIMPANNNIGGVNLGNLPNYLLVFTDGSTRANLQGATKGFIGDIAIDGIQANEVTSGGVAYAGTIYTNDNTLAAWEDLVTQNATPNVNPSQAFGSTGNTTLITDLEYDLATAFTEINALSVTNGYANIDANSLDGLNTQDGIADVVVINITTGFQISNQININGDAEDVFFFRWDEDANFSDGYEGEVRFSNGGGFIPSGGLKPSNFIHVAGVINSSGGGGNPSVPFPQGPRDNDGTGNLIQNGDDFGGGGFFTGYWLTTGDPNNNFENAALSNGIFVGGWYTSATRFSLTSGTSGVYVAPNTQNNNTTQTFPDLGEAANFTLIAGQKLTINGTVCGNVANASATNGNGNATVTGTIDGDLYADLASAPTGLTGNLFPGFPHSTYNSQPVQDQWFAISSAAPSGNPGSEPSAQLFIDIANASNAAKALTPTQTFASISTSSGDVTFTLTSGLNVINIPADPINGSNGKLEVVAGGDLIIDGPADAQVVINVGSDNETNTVSGGMTLDKSSVLLTGGIEPGNVLFNLIAGDFQPNGGSLGAEMNGIYLVRAGSDVKEKADIQGKLTINGAILTDGIHSSEMTIGADVVINCPAITTTNPTTCKGNDGQIQLTITGGTGPYIYNWTNGITSGMGDANPISNLSAGIYSIIIHDSGGFTDTIYVTLQQPANCNNTQSCLGEAANYGILVLENGNLIINSATNISGDVGYSANVTSLDNKKAGNDGPFDGTAYVHSNINSFAYDNGNFLPSGGVVQNNPTEDARLDQANADALAAATFYSNFSPDIVLGNLQDNDNQTINRVGNLTVVEIASLDYKEDVLELVGQAGQNDAFIINVLGDFDFSGSEIRLTNVLPEQVVFNFPNASNILLNKASNIFNGTILAPTAVIEYHNPAIFNGAIIGSNINLHSDFNLHHYGLDINCIEICDNGIDDDADGLVDELDEDCWTPIFPNSIGDLVWLDLDGNGLLAPLEAGIDSMPIMVSNQNTIVVNSSKYPVGTYRDTVLSNISGRFAFDSLPDGNWQMEVLHNPAVYFPTYDVDGGLLNICDFTVTGGIVSSVDNTWCNSGDCAADLDFGLRFNGNLQLGGNVCIDHDNDGICSSGGETHLDAIEVNIFDGSGKYFGGVPTENDGSYLFPFLLDSNYHVVLNAAQQNLNTYQFTTEEEDTPASSIFYIGDNIYQAVALQQDVFGVDYGFTLTPCAVTAVNDSLFNLCPGVEVQDNVGTNDTYTFINTLQYNITDAPSYGTVSIDNNGNFLYIPTQIICGTELFTYQVCNQNHTCCDFAEVVLTFGDTTNPKLRNIPADLTIYCDELLPSPPLVTALDNCPRIAINITENSTQGEDGCSLHDYDLTRVWTATDYCRNSALDKQIIEVVDVIAPDIYKIYTLPNGKKMVAGVMEGVGTNWRTINLPTDFTVSPVLLAQVTTANEDTPVAVQLRNVSISQFEMKITEEENNDNLHAREHVSWVAIEPGVQIEDYPLEADFMLSNDLLQSQNFHQTYPTTPAFFTQAQTTNEKDVATVRSTQITNSDYKIQLIEEQSADAETSHVNEKIGYLAIPQLGAIKDTKHKIFGESHSINVSSNWQTINFTHNYINPIIIANTVSQNEVGAFTIRVRNVTPLGCEIRIEEWENEDGIHAVEAVNYLVIEGSIPIDLPNFCDNGTDSLDIGIDLKAIDNCDVSVMINYEEIEAFFGAKKITQRSWTATDECGNQTTYTQEITCEGVSLELKSLLQGAMLDNNNTGLMRDDLRKKGLIPLVEPYHKLYGFDHVKGNNGVQLDTNLLNIIGPNAIVDWVFLELRATTNIDSVVGTLSGLIQRDGDVVSPQGDTILSFLNTPIGDYFVSVKHRNHIGLATLNPITFNQNLIPMVDFTYEFTPVNGNHATTSFDSQKAMWSGDLNGDGRIIYQGPQNDVFEMFLHILLDDNNTSYLTNYINRGYTENDFNLDGVVIFQGPNNDRANLLFNTILSHPDNPQNFANFIIQVKIGD